MRVFLLKSLGVFFVLSLGFLILKDYAFVFSPFIGIIFAGVGILLILMQNIRMDFEYGIQAASFVEQGLNIEKTFEDPPRIFQIFEDNKLLSYRGNLVSRLFPMGLITLGTGAAGVILALKISAWLGVLVVIIALLAMYAGARSYLKTTRKIMLGD